ncbi:hypothetical protein T4B_7020 [Trichinella pseudospiralis]|uniref:Uncharacterized protein n=1 Tax=Trichinella pseudospiralis TaxID=6337 RepID=A0A0V1J4F0_TRIPS|nr:hypothetical protein T4B_7020 [Trichinella pseudospiralis]
MSYFTAKQGNDPEVGFQVTLTDIIKIREQLHFFISVGSFSHIQAKVNRLVNVIIMTYKRFVVLPFVFVRHFREVSKNLQHRNFTLNRFNNNNNNNNNDNNNNNNNFLFSSLCGAGKRARPRRASFRSAVSQRWLG